MLRSVRVRENSSTLLLCSLWLEAGSRSHTGFHQSNDPLGYCDLSVRTALSQLTIDMEEIPATSLSKLLGIHHFRSQVESSKLSPIVCQRAMN
jgi:hypothetical protein